MFYSLVSAACLLLPSNLLWAAQHPAPKLVCDQPVFNFGERESSGEFEHDFVIRNAGDHALQIFNVRPTCGCLVPTFMAHSIPPGGEANVPVRFIARGRQGSQNKVVYVESNDPDHPSLSLRMEGRIEDPVVIDPRLLFFGRMGAQASVTGTLAVAAVGTNLLGNVTAQIDSTAFSVSAEPTVSNKTARIVVTSRPPLPEGLTRTTLRINTGHPRMPILTTTVSAFVPGTFSVTPPEILIVGRDGDHVRREVLLRAEKNIAFRILAVEPPLKEITCTITSTNTAACRITFPSLPVSSKLEGRTVRIVTDHPSRPEILIPMRVFLR
jgi:hypothetical protein